MSVVNYAGSYRTEERGTIRGHQFNKVETFIFTRPEDSSAALSELVRKARNWFRGLGLYHRVSKLEVLRNWVGKDLLLPPPR
jgi:seryl-tRNA synthetase